MDLKLGKHNKILIPTTLSKREIEVFEYLLKDLSMREISNELFVSEKTIKFHACNIYRKCGLDNTNRQKRISLITKFSRSLL